VGHGQNVARDTERTPKQFRKLIICLFMLKHNTSLVHFVTTEVMYEKRNTDARSRNQFCCVNAIRVTYFECVLSLTYPAWNAHAQYYIVIYGLSDPIIFNHIRISRTRYDFQKQVIEHKTRFFKFHRFTVHFDSLSFITQTHALSHTTMY
jgi:hypothetical protein